MHKTKKTGLSSVKEVEAADFLQVAAWVCSMELSNVICELDAQCVVDSIHGTNEDVTEFGLLIKECRSVLADVGNFSLQFVRHANRVAHTLVRVSRFMLVLRFVLKNQVVYVLCLMKTVMVFL
ncbi:hypothetical protein PTKIN_Ptkin06aG0205400 [Pterospermum kingtungense]